MILWWQAGGERLSRRAAREIARADSVLVSPISLWEIATLLKKGRIVLDRDVYVWSQDLLSDERIEVTPLTPPAAVMAALLPDDFPGDPADRFLYATASDLIAPLITKDGGIRSYAADRKDVKVIW